MVSFADKEGAKGIDDPKERYAGGGVPCLLALKDIEPEVTIEEFIALYD
jgi:hypothetical protein